MRKVILAIDDRPELLETITEMLDIDYRVIGVTSYRSAVDIMEKQKPALFLLDIDMPDISGYDIATKIRQDTRFRHTPILFLTGKASKNDVVKAVESGGNDYIVKPVDRKVLLSKINQYIY